MRKIPKVPGLLTLALCSVAFWFGRISLTTDMLPEPSGPVLDTKLVRAWTNRFPRGPSLTLAAFELRPGPPSPPREGRDVLTRGGGIANVRHVGYTPLLPRFVHSLTPGVFRCMHPEAEPYGA